MEQRTLPEAVASVKCDQMTLPTGGQMASVIHIMVELMTGSGSSTTVETPMETHWVPGATQKIPQLKRNVVRFLPAAPTQRVRQASQKPFQIKLHH